MDDFRLSIRALRDSPMVSILAALSLALGIGANTAIFSLVDSLSLRSLPVVEPQRLVTISSDKAIYGLEPRDPVTLAGAAMTLAAVGAVAGWLPAHRASRIDPLEVLRNH